MPKLSRYENVRLSLEVHTGDPILLEKYVEEEDEDEEEEEEKELRLLIWRSEWLRRRIQHR